MMLAAHARPDLLRDRMLNGGVQRSRPTRESAEPSEMCHEHTGSFSKANSSITTRTDSHIFVHANCHPKLSMDKQHRIHVAMGAPPIEIKPHVSGKVVVCGHTPQKDARPMNRGYAICIDTGQAAAAAYAPRDLWRPNLASQCVRKGHPDAYFRIR